MKKTTNIIVLCTLALLGSPCAYAETSTKNSFKFVNPCERGPLPRVNIVNKPIDRFARELRDFYPHLSKDSSDYIAFELCSDLSIVGNDRALTDRLRFLIGKYGEPAVKARQQQSRSIHSSGSTTGELYQLGLFSNERNADKIVSAVDASGLNGRKSLHNSKGQTFWRVVVTGVSSKATLSKAKSVAKSLGIHDGYLTNG